MRLSTAKIHNAAAQKKTVRLFDGRGLYLEIAPTGSRWWRFKYRFAGKEKLLALGVYPNVSLGEAREQRDGARVFLTHGIDPIVARREALSAPIKAAAQTPVLRLKQAKGEQLIIETPSITVRITKAGTDALRAFLLAKP